VDGLPLKVWAGFMVCMAVLLAWVGLCTLALHPILPPHGSPEAGPAIYQMGPPR
jgi:hypothetical protein